mmetsp:Transcript_35410/g.106995  ORF Transcript_35410/g.106995 Transcript_35410/m.106995 type:complete len:254 (+) Transcript_35410:162-923(+)
MSRRRSRRGVCGDWRDDLLRHRLERLSGRHVPQRLFRRAHHVRVDAHAAQLRADAVRHVEVLLALRLHPTVQQRLRLRGLPGGGCRGRLGRPHDVGLDADGPELRAEGVRHVPVLVTLRHDPLVQLLLRVHVEPRVRAGGVAPGGAQDVGLQSEGAQISADRVGSREVLLPLRPDPVVQLGLDLRGRLQLLHPPLLLHALPLRRPGVVGLDALLAEFGADGVRRGEVLVALGRHPPVQLGLDPGVLQGKGCAG